MRFINISTYKFVSMDNLPTLRVELLQLCQPLLIKGTVLLSLEGINLALSVPPHALTLLTHYFARDDRLRDLVLKKSESTHQPFRRLQVKIKNEIIRMNDPTIQPEQHTVTHLSPKDFKQWLDEGKAMTILDTRNDYEIKVGTFKQAIGLDIHHFSDFPDAAANQLTDVSKTQPVVMFCTGGVRCEKAGPALERQGFSQVYQLEGGILNYFEQCGDAHFEGECFVFDDRVAVNGTLAPSYKGYCPNCAEPLTEPYRDLPPWERVKQCQCYTCRHEAT